MTGGHLKEPQEFYPETFMSDKSKRSHRSFSAEFKQDAVHVVVKQELLVQGGWTKFESFDDITQARFSVFQYIKHVSNQIEFDRQSDTEHPTKSKNNIKQNSPSKPSFQASVPDRLPQK